MLELYLQENHRMAAKRGNRTKKRIKNRAKHDREVLKRRRIRRRKAAGK